MLRGVHPAGPAGSPRVGSEGGCGVAGGGRSQPVGAGHLAQASPCSPRAGPIPSAPQGPRAARSVAAASLALGELRAEAANLGTESVLVQ